MSDSHGSGRSPDDPASRETPAAEQSPRGAPGADLDLSRRDFIGATGAALAAANAAPLAAQEPMPGSRRSDNETGVPTTRISVTVNGTRHR
ncbi:MAG TPA: hypothetical protein VIV14_02830, partial [Gammaproteobacteria bacterium]